ncbi:CRP/FNR family transcriptional regulator, anaerobic regulatory protein [Cohnella sp. OV330]|uniref:Crp/Fnr family transcriptional regulator n=1 Tax=Cohnella sp. OV330 TaxID=1855288 RepID=UPI0008E021B3|nr:Crp/Fnr family transcriptional regulator [Cohnella sp. OV330]SFA97896.1 CRP/FNR family transcriptional regulator, anaerobic regulatory protein [Cohnella sp. OV330]
MGEALKKKAAGERQQDNGLGIRRFFSEDQFGRLEELMYPKRAEKGSSLFWEGDSAGKLYYLRSGKVKLRKSTDEGKDFTLSIMQAGDLIWEPENGLSSVHTFSAEVLEEAELGVVQWKDLEILLYRYGDFAVKFMNWMAIAQRVSESKFRDLLLFGKPGALASTLIRMANTYGIATDEGIKITLKLTHTEIADLIGTSRESVNRMLNGFKEEGIIDIRQGRIYVLQLNALREICHCPTCPGCPKEICRI